jgi:hypothetical protein
MTEHITSLTINGFKITLIANDDIVVERGETRISMKGLIHLQQRVDYLEALVEEFTYLPDIGVAFQRAKERFESAPN